MVAPRRAPAPAPRPAPRAVSAPPKAAPRPAPAPARPAPRPAPASAKAIAKAPPKPAAKITLPPQAAAKPATAAAKPVSASAKPAARSVGSADAAERRALSSPRPAPAPAKPGALSAMKGGNAALTSKDPAPKPTSGYSAYGTAKPVSAPRRAPRPTPQPASQPQQASFIEHAVTPFAAAAKEAGNKVQWYHQLGDAALLASTVIPIAGQIGRAAIIGRAGVLAGTAAVKAGATQTAATVATKAVPKALPSGKLPATTGPKALPSGTSATPNITLQATAATNALKDAAVNTGRFVAGSWRGAGESAAKIQHLAKTGVEAGVTTAGVLARSYGDQGYNNYVKERTQQASKAGVLSAVGSAISPFLSPVQERIAYADYKAEANRNANANANPLMSPTVSADSLMGAATTTNAIDRARRNTPVEGSSSGVQTAAALADLANPVNVLIGSGVAAGAVALGRGAWNLGKTIAGSLQRGSTVRPTRPNQPLQLEPGSAPTQPSSGQPAVPQHAGLPGTRSSTTRGTQLDDDLREYLPSYFPTALKPGGGPDVWRATVNPPAGRATPTGGTPTGGTPPSNRAALPPGNPPVPAGRATPTGGTPTGGTPPTSGGASSARFPGDPSRQSWGSPQPSPSRNPTTSRPFAEPEPPPTTGSPLIPRPNTVPTRPTRTPVANSPARQPVGNVSTRPVTVPARNPASVTAPSSSGSVNRPTPATNAVITGDPALNPNPREEWATVLNSVPATETSPQVSIPTRNPPVTSFDNPPPPIIPLRGKEGDSGPSGLHRGWWGGTDVSAAAAARSTGTSRGQQSRLIQNPRLVSSLPSAYTGETPGTRSTTPESYKGERKPSEEEKSTKDAK